MRQYFTKSLLLLILAVFICSVIYPLIVWVIGQIFFPFQANGSLLLNKEDGSVIGSQLIAQAFIKDEYFHPRPSAASYDASASSSSSLAASNYALRDRVARTIGSLAHYRNIEFWFRQDRFRGNRHIVAQWATLHPELAAAWVEESAIHHSFVNNWAKSHPTLITTPITSTELAVLFFTSFSQDHPGKFPLSKDQEIQSIFFDMWLQDHPHIDLQTIPADMVLTSASGLDPHITLQNALYQLERVSSRWAIILNRDPAQMRQEIRAILQKNTQAPWNGLIGEKLINVLLVNLELKRRYGCNSSPCNLHVYIHSAAGR